MLTCGGGSLIGIASKRGRARKLGSTANGSPLRCRPADLLSEFVRVLGLGLFEPPRLGQQEQAAARLGESFRVDPNEW